MDKLATMLQFHGRLKRLPFLGYSILLILFGLAIIILSFVLALLGIGGYSQLILFGAFALYSLVAMIALQVRRLHDIGLSGFFVILPFAVILVCYGIFIIQFGVDPVQAIRMFERENTFPLILHIPNYVSFLFVLFLLFFPGNKSFNKYGDGDEDDAEFISAAQLKAMQRERKGKSLHRQPADQKAKVKNEMPETVFKAVLAEPLLQNQLVQVKMIKEENSFIKAIFVPKTLDRIDITVAANGKVKNKMDAKMFLSNLNFKVKYVA